MTPSCPLLWKQEAEDLLEQKKQSNFRKQDLAHLHFDKKGMDWKIFYNVNMSARKKENVKNGIFDASNWEPKPSEIGRAHV